MSVVASPAVRAGVAALRWRPRHRLGTVSLLQLFVRIGLVNNLLALILVYTAQALPITIFILGAFMREVPGELKDAARVDGASEYRIYRLVVPLVRPALSVIATFT